MQSHLVIQISYRWRSKDHTVRDYIQIQSSNLVYEVQDYYTNNTDPILNRHKESFGQIIPEAKFKVTVYY